MWCQAPSGGFASADDPQAATIGDLGADMAARGLASTPEVGMKPADVASGEPQPGLTAAKLAAVTRVTAIVAGIFAVAGGLLMWRIAGYTAMDGGTGASFMPSWVNAGSVLLSVAPAGAGALVAIVGARGLRCARIGLWVLALASSVFIAETCAPFTGLGALYGALVVGDVPVAVTIALLALGLRRAAGRQPRWHLELVPLAAGAAVLLAAVPLVTVSWGSPYGPGSGTVTGFVAKCTPAEEKASGAGGDTSRVVTVSVQNQAGQAVASQRLPFATSGARYRMTLPAGTYTVTAATTAGASGSDTTYLPAGRAIEVDFKPADDINCL
jgi:hypothetical protein